MDLKSTSIMLNPEDIITLNVGGLYFNTTLDTLTQRIDKRDESGSLVDEGNYFSVMFTQNFFELQQDEKNAFFVDRDGTYFRYILNYLRAGGDLKNCVFPWNNKDAMDELINEAEFYSLTTLARFLRKSVNGETQDAKTIQKVVPEKSSEPTLTVNSNHDLFIVDSAIEADTTLVRDFNVKKFNYFEIQCNFRSEWSFLEFGLLQPSAPFERHAIHYECEDSRSNKGKASVFGLWFDILRRRLCVYVNGREANELTLFNVPVSSDFHFFVETNKANVVKVRQCAVHPHLDN